VKFEFEKEKMEALGIAGVFLFGSQALGTADKVSDFDFAIMLKDRKVLTDYNQSNKIYDELYDILSSQIKKLCNIDIVFIQSADLQFRYHVVRDGILLYMGDQKIVSDFLENTMESYADFAPLRRQFHEAILQRI
jgi:predicted nucleotidyltransferase